MSRLEDRLIRLEGNFGWYPHECEELVIPTGVPRPGDDSGDHPTGRCYVCGKPLEDGR